jgi:hypothetical protein
MLKTLNLAHIIEEKEKSTRSFGEGTKAQSKIVG